MRAAALAVALVGVLAAPAVAETFDELAAGARPIALDELAWSVTPACAAGDDVQQRQCRQLHARVKAAVAPAMLVEVEQATFTIGAWDPKQRVLAFQIGSCVRCVTPVRIAGKDWRVVIATGKARVEKGALRADPIYDGARPFPTEAAARAWATSLAPVRVEMIVSGARARVVGGVPVVELASSGYRVTSRCDGKVVVAFPAAADLPPDKQACAKPAP